MSLNLSLKPRYRSRIRRQRLRILWLGGLALLLASLVALQRVWEPGQTLAGFGQKVWSSVSVVGPRLRLVSNQAQLQIGPAKSDSVVMVASTVIESPRSDAYTANLYTFTGKDVVPWPSVGGRATLQTYVVQPGDSLWQIAEQFELDIDTLRWSNPELERNPDILTIGAELRILPVPGVYHFVAADETVESIAVQYGVAPTDITDYPPNALFPPFDLESGTGLIIPYGRKNIVTPKPSLAPGADLAWPLVGVITNGFKPDHLAIDIGAPYGTTVFAADDGTITYADWAQTGYGYTIIIDHGDGRETWYNHLKGTLLGTGNFVSRGTPIGEVGSTGHSTGPHLHLELRINGQRVTPLDYLPGETPR